MNFPSPRRPAGLPLLVLAALAGLAAIGCGSGKGTVTGVVKYDGQPLPSGTITFQPQTGEKQPVSSDITDGKYTIPNIQAGSAKVTVITLPPAKGGAPLGGAAPIQPTRAAATAAASAAKYVPIPQKYSSLDKSGLTYEVKGGEQTKDFELTR